MRKTIKEKLLEVSHLIVMFFVSVFIIVLFFKLQSTANTYKNEKIVINQYDKQVQINIYLPDKKLNKVSDFICKSNPHLSKQYCNSIANTFIQVSKEQDVPLEILLAVAYTESKFNNMVVSPANCIGVMQINYKVWKDILNIPSEGLLFDANYNIRLGAYILKYYYNQTKDWGKALYRYFGISDYGHKYKIKVLNKANKIKKELKSNV